MTHREILEAFIEGETVGFEQSTGEIVKFKLVGGEIKNLAGDHAIGWVLANSENVEILREPLTWLEACKYMQEGKKTKQGNTLIYYQSRMMFTSIDGGTFVTFSDIDLDGEFFLEE